MNLNNKGFGVTPILLAILLVGALGFGGYYVWSKSNSKLGKGKLATAERVSAPSECDSKECFQDNFEKCQPAYYKAQAFSTGAEFYYEVISGDAESCKMLHRSSSNNLEMICSYDNPSLNVEFDSYSLKKETEVSFGQENDCRGPLKDHLAKS